jgi:hypothetical protein
MLDIHSIVSQVKHNCNISDAKYWGFYSLCGLLLRFRDLYKTEHNLKPWDEVTHDRIVKWIDRREKLWEKLSSLDFQTIQINNSGYNPFDVKGINARLLKKGFLYGAGYGNHLKPTFIFAKIAKKHKTGRYNIFFTGKEFARDLSTSPAMLQGNTIIARQETMKLFLMNKFVEMQSYKHDTALSCAFSEYGISKNITVKFPARDFKRRFSSTARKELSTYIYHEIGEASQRKIMGKWWKELIFKKPYNRTELLLRGLKDILADTCKQGMLAHIIEQKKAGSLCFYIAFLGGFRKIMFHNIVTAYDEFLKSRNWDLIERARRDGYKKAKESIKILKEITFIKKCSHDEIERKLLKIFTEG